MVAPCTDIDLAHRDPETILGPLLWLRTRLARGEPHGSERDHLVRALVDHCTALAAHPGVPAALRVALGGIAIEQRYRVTRYA